MTTAPGPLQRLLARLVRAAALLLAASAFAFVVCELMPGDTYSELRIDPTVSRDAIAALQENADSAHRMPIRYVIWLGSVLRGDFGHSRSYGTAVAPLVATRLARTIGLTVLSAIVTWALAVPLGVWAAARHSRADGRVLALFATSLLACPDLLIATVLLVVAADTGFLATRGHLALPLAAIGLSATPLVVRHVRANVLAVLSDPYIAAAAARGVPRTRLVCRSALRAAAGPLVALFGVSFAALFSTAMIVEVVLGRPGVGPLLVEAVLSRDTPVILAGVVASTVLLLAGNTIADLLIVACDPRVEAA